MSCFPVILSSPSGGGKTTIAKELLRRRGDLGYSVSCTTRPPREGEMEGRDYYFLAPDEFDAARARGELAESAEVHGYLYGTLKREVARVLESGRHVVMDIDVQGARQLRDVYPDSVLVFVIPPDAGVLMKRLTARGTENRQSMTRRISSAVAELRAMGSYSYVVVNADLERAVNSVSAIIDAESARPFRIDGINERVQRMVDDLERELEKMNRS
ncbi:MAG TPA: guanylate kinase [Gemmatimonadaceae bacterium]|nr:guanylate kinase [Gemmatimonadaceae bacterium]